MDGTMRLESEIRQQAEAPQYGATQAMGELLESIEFLRDAVSTLEGKLTPVLGPEMASATEGQTSPQAVSSALLDSIVVARRKVQDTTVWVSALRKRVEL